MSEESGAPEPQEPLRVVTEDEVPEPPYQRKHDHLNIVGFAPSWKDTPWEAEADLWGMNALYKVADDKPWDAWFQLHDIKKHHPHDFDEHMEWISKSGLPVFMWDKEIEKYPLPNAIAYPRDEMVAVFGSYFTNTVSWMMALGIALGYKSMGIYGIDMAQDSEYGSQRPSCEYFIGWARGMGIDVFIPETSDLLKSPFLYGYEDPSLIRTKMEARLKELQERAAQTQQQRDQAQAGFFQLQGAIEDVQYWLKNWVHDSDKAE